MESALNIIDVAEMNRLAKGLGECLVGVSGGADSMVLLHWLAENRNRLEFGFRVMHVDHGIHENSQEWAAHVADECARLGVPCEVQKVDLVGLGNNLEYAARQARYAAFCRAGNRAIILAQHANDQCEGFFLKLFRGSGVKGLKVMTESGPCWYDPSITVLRPMLSVTRDQIDEMVLLGGISHVEDPSNSDDRYDRNYVRNAIWPAIKQRFDIADINIVRSINHIREAWELTIMLADQDIKHVTMDDDVLNWCKLRDLGYLRIKNLLLRILDLHGVYGFSINHVEQFAQGLLSADMDARNELALKGFTMNKIGKKIYVGRNHRKVA
jgi:tRNA(Ile)-lysidine synthase